jgi:hypothetical protein
MAKGNKFNNGVWEQGTPEIVLAYQHDTPGQKVEEYVEGLQLQNEKKKLNAKKQFTQVFDNPLKGFPYNEEFEVKEIKEELSTFFEEEEEVIVNETVNYHTKISNINIANAMKNNRMLKKYVNVVPGSGTSDTYEIASLLSKKMKKFGFDKKEVKAIEDVMQTAFATNESVKEEVEEKPVQESIEKTTEKLVERNMLGRLAKQLRLNEEGKQKMFNYFEKGEL